MNVTVDCQVCEESFNCANRKPLVLPCGHTYCLACLTDIETSGDKLCPACRESWDCNAYTLPVSCMLILNNSESKNAEEDEKLDYDVCSLHSNPLEYWCCKCHVATCKKCIPEKHYAHGNIAFESLFETAERVDNLKDKFLREIGPKVQADINASTEICKEGMKVIELISESQKTLLSCMKFLQAQEKSINDVIEGFEIEGSASVKGRLEDLAKVMTRCDMQHSSLSQKMEVACTKLSTLNAGIKLMRENLRDTKQALLFEELNWTIEGEKNALKILNVLETSDVQPPHSVTVMSTQSNPIHSLPELLIALARKGCSIRLLLLDSFFYGVQFLTDHFRLEPAFKDDVGKNLASFYGYIDRKSNWLKLETTKLSELGLRLDSGAAVAELNAIVSKNFEKLVQGTNRPTPTSTLARNPRVANAQQQSVVGKTELVISKAVIPVDVSTPVQMTPNVSLRLYVLELEDKEVTWCSEVLPKLIPPPAHKSCELWLLQCKLSRAGLEKLVPVVRKTRAKLLRLHAPELSDAEKNQVYTFGRQYGLTIMSTSINI